MKFIDFIIQIAGEYIPNTAPDGTPLLGLASINFAALAGYAIIFAVIWWILHMINNLFFSRR